MKKYNYKKSKRHFISGNDMNFYIDLPPEMLLSKKLNIFKWIFNILKKVIDYIRNI